MALTLRRNKSLPLTHDELDDNFEYLSSSLASITVSTSTGSFVYSGSFDGSSTVTLYSADTNYNLDLSALAGGGGGSDITSLNNFTGSAQISLTALNTATGSYLYSGSFDGSNTITLYSADTNYSLDLSALSGGGGSTDITALNNFTGSINTYTSSLVSLLSDRQFAFWDDSLKVFRGTHVRVHYANSSYAKGINIGYLSSFNNGFTIYESSNDPQAKNEDHVILSDNSGSNLIIRNGGKEAGDGYIFLRVDEPGLSGQVVNVARFGGPEKSAYLYHSGSNVFRTEFIDSEASIIVSGSISGSKNVFFPGLPNTTTANIVGFDTTTGQLTYYSTGSFGSGGGTVDTGSLLYSGSYNSVASAITLYSANQNYTLDLSGLAGGGGGFPITASDEGSDLTNSMSKIDFVGNAVTATNVGSIVTVTINTGSAASATDITALNNFTGSAQISLDALNIFSGSANTRLSSLEAATGSYVYSGSFDGSTTLTLYSADTNYSLDLSALAGGSTDITALNNFTGSAQISLDVLNAATASYVTNDQTSSFLENLYTTDGTLSGARTVTQNGNGLTFNGQGAFNTFDISSGGRFNISGSTNVKIEGLQSGTQANVIGIDSQGLLYVQATSSIAGGGGSGTVTSVTVSGSNGVSGSGTITSSGTIVLQHADTSAQGSVNNSGNTFIQDITLDGFGHVTSMSSATVGATQVNSSAIYAESTTGFNVHSYPNYEVVNINATNIEANAPKTVGGDTNRLLAIATMEVGNPAVSLQNCVFNYELYNSTQTSTVAGSQGAFSAYLLPGGEGAPNTTFTFTLPINDTNVNDGDTIQLRAKAYAVGAYATASIYYASLTLLDME